MEDYINKRYPMLLAGFNRSCYSGTAFQGKARRAEEGGGANLEPLLPETGDSNIQGNEDMC